MGRARLLSYFDRQIEKQGWEFQTNWTSPLSSGSIWKLNTAKEGILIGTLHVFDSGFDPIRVRFSINPADPTAGTDSGSWSSGTSN